MERFADVCTIIFIVAALLLGIFTETNWKPKKYFTTWIVVICVALATTLISVVFVVLYGNADQMWTLSWLLFD